MLTYPLNEYRVQEYNLLLKFMPVLRVDGEIVLPSTFEKVEVRDIPGAVEANISYKGKVFTTRIIPLLEGRGDLTWHGAVLYEVESDSEEEVDIMLGGGDVINLIWGFESSTMKEDNVLPLDGLKKRSPRSLTFIGGRDKLNMGISTSGMITTINNLTAIAFKKGSGYILTGYTESAEELDQLMRLNVREEKSKYEKYYHNLMANTIETPEKVMNEAFASAIYNLEYSWIEPFGWVECLHHWLALWYMQVTPAAEWLGQADRSRSSIEEHAAYRFDDGGIPMFIPNHNHMKEKVRRNDWGGGNPYWVWQVRHHLKQTGDKAFAQEMLPVVREVIKQTLSKYDRDGNGLIAYGLQIGNQEDFVANPYEGSVPTMELLNMYRTMSELHQFVGNDKEAKQWEHKADVVNQQLYKTFWIKDIGRFGYYKDPVAGVLPDGQYQTYLYPAIYSLVDQYDQYSGLRHLMDRLMDSEGAVFASNNFPFHVENSVSTWGMQRGEAQQPWAAMGYAAIGMNNMTWKPLKAMAIWAQDPRRPGSWPETGPEPTPAYFTPPAGLYISTVIENLFGIKKDVPNGVLHIEPSFPDHWPYARLNVSEVTARYERQGNTLKYTIENDFDLKIQVKWRLPVSRITACKVNGKAVKYELEAGVNHIALCFDAPSGKKAVIEIEYAPVDFSVEAPFSIAGGEMLTAKIKGAQLINITDKAGVLESIETLTPSSFSGVVQSGLLDDYHKFNQLGQLNFSRRTLFMNCQTWEGIPFIVPVDVTILPRWEAALNGTVKREGDNYLVPVLVRNNINRSLAGKAYFEIGGQSIPVSLNLAKRTEGQMTITVPDNPNLTTGENVGVISIGEESPVRVPFRIRKSVQDVVFKPIVLPSDDFIPDEDWKKLRIMPGYPHIFFTFSQAQWPVPMESMKGVSQIEIEQIPGLKFNLKEQKFIPISHLSGKTSYNLPIEKRTYKKLYVLLLPFVDNHVIFTDVARISVYSDNQIVASKTLSYPGNVDYFVSNRNPTSFATYREKRENAYALLLPLLSTDQPDWSEGKPPAFPQPKYWSTSIPVTSESCTMSLIEIELKKGITADRIVFESLGALPAIGIVAVTAELGEESDFELER